MSAHAATRPRPHRQPASVLFDAPGPRTRRAIAIGNTVAVLAVLAGLAWAASVMNANGQFEARRWTVLFTWDTWRYFFIPGILDTLKAAALAVVGAGAFGLVFGVGRLSRHRWIRWPASIVVEFFRSVPVLLMMIFVWLLLGHFKVTWLGDPALPGVVTALVLYNGSVVAELVRSGVHSLPAGQREAAAAIGLRRGQSLMAVEVPQALLAMLPSLITQLVVALKDSALGSMITYTELLQESRRLASANSNPLQALAMAAVIFIIMNTALSWLATRASERLRGRREIRPVPAVDDVPPSVSASVEIELGREDADDEAREDALVEHGIQPNLLDPRDVHAV
jgi:glutamate transport system permease protein